MLSLLTRALTYTALPERELATYAHVRSTAGRGAMGVAATEGADAAEDPTALVAVTVNVYAVPFVRPRTVELVPVGVVPVHAEHAGDGVIV
jgi:hypothetical protein